MRAAAALFLLATVFAVAAIASPPQTISYQGYLKNSSGTPASGPVAMTFSLYSSNPARNNPLWRESQPTVTLTGGTYNVQLGSETPLNLPFDRQYWLGVRVESDPELTPLQALASVPYALHAATAESAVSAATVNGQTLAQLDARYSDPLQTRATSPQIATLRWDQVAGSASGKLIPIGTAPSALAFDGRYVWVANAGDGLSAGTLQKVEPATGSLVGAPVAVGVNPQALAFDGTSLWVALKGGDAVAKVNPTDGAVLTSCATGGNGPAALAYDGTHLWVANSASNNVTRINPATCTVAAGPWLVGTNPTALAFDGTSMWVANSGGNTVTRISLDGASKANYTVLTNPVSLAYDGVGDTVWVASRDSNGVVVLDRGTGYPQPPMATGTSPTAIIFDGVNHWLTSNDGVSKIGDYGIIGTFASNGTPTALVFDGASIWAAYQGKNAVAKLTSAAVAVGPMVVGSGNIAAKAVVEQTIADGAVTTDKIRDGAVTAAKLNLSSAGKIGIGTASPSEQLEITGNLRLPATTASTGIIKSGTNTLIHTYGGDYNFFAGINAGNLTMTGNSNIGIGYQALASNTTGYWNTAGGYRALRFNTTGGQNTANGFSSLFFNTSGYSNSASGFFALFSNSTGYNNTASGDSALFSNTTGSYNTAVGYQAGYTTNPARANITGANNTFIGANAGPGVSTQLNNATAIGANALVSASNSLVLGDAGANAVNVGIGTATPTVPLDVVGNVRINDKDIYLRGDANHGLGWYGSGKLFSGTNIDGPVLFGWSGGALGTTYGGQKGALLWYNDQRVWMPGNLSVSGSISKGSGSFKIDHPLDPQNKYLYHSFVESPDMMNIYNGNLTTDEKGYATVELPAWFEALNREFRYQLTVIDEGDSAGFTLAKVVRGVAESRFTIRTSAPSTRVSWQVTGIRKDPFAEAHRIQVEEEKPAAEQGTCLHPEACR